MRVTMKNHDLFATRVWEFDCAGLTPHFAPWRARVEALRLSAPEPAGRSNKAGWNSQTTLFTLPEFLPLREVAAKAFSAVLEDMSVGKARFALQAWANVNDPGGYNVAHVHAGAMLSGCFYLTVPPGAGAIVLRDPRPGAVHSLFQGGGVNHCQSATVAPREGLLLVFPAWLEHHVNAHEGEVPRVSIAMNAMPVQP